MLKRFEAIWSIGVLLLLAGCGNKIERNIDKLGGAGKEREQAIMELTLAKEYAIPPLMDALGDAKRSAEVRADVAEILFKMYVRERDRRIVPTLLEHVGDEDSVVREKIAVVLGDIGKEEALSPLLNRLEVEEDADVKRALLGAIEVLGDLLLEIDTISMSLDIKLTEEQKAKFVGILTEIRSDETDRDLKAKAEEVLEVIAEEISQEAEKLVLKADLKDAEEKFLAARELVPESMNVSHKLGKFYFENGQEKKGSEVLRRYGMVTDVRRLSPAPLIDGDLGDACWLRITPHTEFYQCIYKMKAYPIEGRSEVYMGYTGDALYLGVKGYEPSTTGLRANVTERDGPVHADDCVEAFFDTQRDEQSYYHLMVNTLGTIADQNRLGGRAPVDASWNGAYELKTAVEDTFWTLEIKIPFKEFEAKVKRGTVWGFNIARVRIANASEYGQWVPTYGSSHRPDRFGFMIFH